MYLLTKLSPWFAQFHEVNFIKAVCLICLNHFPTVFSSGYQTHGSQLSLFFQEGRFHIKLVIYHSLKAISPQLTTQTLFVVAKPLKRTHPVSTY